MIIRIADGISAKEGDKFIIFADGLLHYKEGVIKMIRPTSIIVDFFDHWIEFGIEYIGLFEEHCGYIRKFYSSHAEGLIVKTFD